MKISQKMTDLFEKYCNINTSFANGRHYAKVINLIKPLLEDSGFVTKEIKIPQKIAGGKNRINLIAELNKDSTLQTLIIYNHIDVVPADYKGAFKFHIKNNRAYARGAADHKGSTIAVLDSLMKIKREKLRFNLIFLLTTDEETHQLPQLEYLEKYLKIDPKNTLCFDPDTFAGGVTNSHLGLYQFTIKTFGKSVHSGMSHLGINAIKSLMSIYPTLEKIEQKYLSLNSDVQSFPKDGKTAKARSSFNINVIKGGLANCIVPDKAALTLDLRLTPEFNVAKEQKWIKNKLTNLFRNKNKKFEMTDGEICEGYVSQHHEIDKFESILKEVSGESGKYCVMGSTPVAHWTKKLKIPHFGLGVARYDSNVHGTNENCKLEDLATLSNVFSKYVHEENSN